MTRTWSRRLGAEFLGTMFLLAAVVGSGIMGERLAAGNVAIALLANSIATGAALAALIITFGPISGAHFNPVVTLAEMLRREFSVRDSAVYIAAQITGAFAGVALAHLMFGLAFVQRSTHLRGGVGQVVAEFVATLGLLLVISSCARHQPAGCPWAVGAYITGAYWFTASTSFANPAVTLARGMTNTFAGIAPRSIFGFVAAQVVAVPAAVLMWRWLNASRST